MLSQVAVQLLVNLVQEEAHRSQTRHEEQSTHQNENHQKSRSQATIERSHHPRDSSPVSVGSEKR